jgi:transposase-like protein
VGIKNEQPEFPKTLQEAMVYFADQDRALDFFVGMRWPNGVSCPRCNSSRVSFTAKRKVWTCNDCPNRRQFSFKVGTIMEDSPIGLDKWLVGMWLITSAKNGISSYELHRTLGITQKSAWFLSHRIRLALQNGTIEKMGGTVEVDETYIGGKARNMHYAKRKERINGKTGGMHMTPVQGLLERHSKGSRVILKAVKTTRGTELRGNVREYVLKGSHVYTDAAPAYEKLAVESDFTHKVIDHAEKYVDGVVHTNGLENFWCLLKRGIKGTYVSVEPFHLFRYLDEQAFRFNERKSTDSERFLKAIPSLIGRHLTYKGLTGNVGMEYS